MSRRTHRWADFQSPAGSAIGEQGFDTVTEINTLYAAAERDLATGQLVSARRNLAIVLSATGEHPAVLHLAALVEKRAGTTAAAKAFFARALAAAPNDPAIHGNHANLLADLNETDGALAAYARALALAPGFVDARYNRALLLQRIGRPEEALTDLDRAIAASPALAKCHAARGQVLRSMERIDDAASAYDRALAIEPARRIARHARARIAMERGEADAAARYRSALQAQPDNLELMLGLSEALAASGDPSAIPYLGDRVAANPGWTEGHARLAAMRVEAGHGTAFADHFAAALKARPLDIALRRAHWRTLAAVGDYGRAREAVDVALAEGTADPQTVLEAAIYTSEAGDSVDAERRFAALPITPNALVARGRNALRAGDPCSAASFLEQAVALDPSSVAGWAHLGLSWRSTGDERHYWLCQQPGLVATIDLALDEPTLIQIADVLRAIHRTRAHPLGQSLRGGTQTPGRLFWRTEPELRSLQALLTAAVETHRRGLPPFDPSHPLLRHRDTAMVIAGSWSVRLIGNGFHVHHIHPQGVLSSACYIALPPIGGDDARAGWLELGAPPVELGLSLSPLATVQPKPGRLALFPSYLFHGTRPFADGERLTVAFDVIADGARST